MIIKKAEYVISAVSPKQYPAGNLPEIALVGRSNVGKSSLINKLVNRKNLAKTSSKPGKTRTMNFYLINDEFYFVDLPGYGYAQVSKEMKSAWGKMIETYLTKRANLKGVIQLIDFRHLPTADDLMMWEWLKYYSLPVIHVGTKLDKVPRSQWARKKKEIIQSLNLPDSNKFIPFSAESGLGKEAIWDLITSWLKQNCDA